MNAKEIIGVVIAAGLVFGFVGIVGAKLAENHARNEYREVVKSYVDSIDGDETMVNEIVNEADEWIKKVIK